MNLSSFLSSAFRQGINLLKFSSPCPESDIRDLITHRNYLQSKPERTKEELELLEQYEVIIQELRDREKRPVRIERTVTLKNI